MTSARTCYCKQEENFAARKKDNNCGLRNGNQCFTSVASRTSTIKNENSGESSRRGRSFTDEKTSNRSRSVEAQSSGPVLSPETSIALENAEKIINNAKMQLVEVCAMSNCLNSLRSTRNIYSDDPPLDDETEELLYIRELVATKFQEASSIKSDANSNQANSARSEKPPSRVSAQVDLSASKFRMSRRHGDWKSNLLEHKSDDRVSPSRNNCSSTKEPSKKEETISRDNHASDYHQRESSAAECGVRARGAACRIQMGPSVSIVADHRLTKQNLEDVHISPCPFLPQNTATYTLCHDVDEKSIGRKANETETSRELKSSSAELDSLQRKKRERLTEATNGSLIKPSKSVEDVAHVGNFNPEQIESSESRDYGKKKKNQKLGSQNVKDKISNRETMVSDASEKPDTGDEEQKPRNEKQMKIIASDDIDNRCAENEEIFNNTSDIDERDARLQKEKRDIADKEMWKNRRFYRITDEHLTNTFDSQNGQEKLRDNVNKDTTRRQSPIFEYRNNFQWEMDDSNDLADLYRPRFDNLNSVLLSNDRKLRHVARATKTFAELLSRPEFAKLKADVATQSGRCEKFYREPFADKNCKSLLNRVTSSSEIELKNEDLTVASHLETNANDAQRTKSSDCPTSNNDRTKNSVESSVYPESDGSEALRIFRDNTIQTKPAPSSESSSDIATLFSNLDPALSSTHTQACRHGERRIVRTNQSADTKLRAANVNEFSENRVHWNDHSDNDDVSFARVFQGLRDTSEATDRFVAYILQDESHSIEKKIRHALRESAIVPATIRKLLNRLSESVRTTCQTETLNILKTILSDVQDCTDQKVISKASNDKKQSSQNVPDLAEHDDSERFFDERSSDTGKNERNTETANIIEPVKTDVKNESDKSIDEENEKDDKKTHSENVIDPFVQANRAIKEPILRIQGAEDNNNNASEQISRESRRDLKNPDKYPRDFSEIRGEETAESAPLSESGSGNKSKENLHSEAESLRQISDIHSDDDDIGDLQNSKTTNEERKSKSNHDLTTTDTNQERHKDKPSDVRNNKNSIRGDEFTDKNSVQTFAIDTNKDTSVAVLKEAAIEKEQHSGSVSMQNKIGGDEITEASEKQLDSIGTKIVDENSTRKDASFPLSATKDVEIAKNNNNLQQSAIATQTSDCSTSCCSVRNSVSNVKNKKPLLKEVSSRDEQTCFNIAGKSNSTENTKLLKGDEPKDEKENAESSDDQTTNTLSKGQVNQLSVSNSSVSNALLDPDDRSKSSGAFNAITKSIETSVETSHSEGELYMPSSCSYSLGEVRILKKSDLIANSTTDRENSAMFLVTKSMLTSLNDSTMSLSESSSHV
ncbi:protein PFC0760c-like isoform X2 [Pseudomyrmex gracilis]|nr:protein PFC0760c-like isoform X2 [Pseudomyrmex gracilis]XP_020299885.1 protein PFC0760c-like isoform X2 [Pseudomyrmex gracilis]